VIQVIDTKTRDANSVPRHADTLPSRLQLMLYRQLLVDVLRADPVMFLDLWTRLDCDVGLPFSKHFKTDMNTMIISNELHLRLLDAGCLLDMLEPLQESMEQMATREVAQALSLVYRKRNAAKGHKPRRPENANEAMEFKDESQPEVGGTTCTPNSDAAHIEDESPSRKRKREECLDKSTDAESQSVTPSGGTDRLQSPQELERGLIGTKKFKFNGQILDEHMKSILRWWYGERPSAGVSLENTHRCRSCEYRDGCEWREVKARELSLKKQ